MELIKVTKEGKLLLNDVGRCRDGAQSRRDKACNVRELDVIGRGWHASGIAKARGVLLGVWEGDGVVTTTGLNLVTPSIPTGRGVHEQRMNDHWQPPQYFPLKCVGQRMRRKAMASTSSVGNGIYAYWRHT